MLETMITGGAYFMLVVVIVLPIAFLVWAILDRLFP